MLSALLIDHDGTLVNSEPCQHLIWQGILAEFGIEFSFEEFIPRIGIPGDVTADYFVKHYGLPISGAELAILKEQATADYLLNNAFPLMDGMTVLLNWAKSKGLKIAIVSGSERASVMRSLALHELNHVIDLVVAGDDVVNNKPAPDCYLTAMLDLDVRADQVIAIEDSENGIRAAKQAGLTCFAIKHAFSQDEQLKLADQSFEHHLSLLRSLAKLV